MRVRSLFLVLCGWWLGAGNVLHGDALPPRTVGLSPKKGICLTTNKTNAMTWRSKVEALDVSWHYSWGGTLPSEGLEGVEFVPMVWGYWGRSERFLGLMETLREQGRQGEVEHLLGFNEPDGKEQSNLSVERALEAWPQLMSTGLRLGSPGAVHADNEWMQAFMEGAKEQNLRVDFVTMHWYGGPNVESLITRIERVHQMYGKPIWITEFAVGDWEATTREEHRYTPERVLSFMKEVLPRLEALDCVERYSWFPADEDSAALGSSALFHRDGQLTSLGEFYRSYRAGFLHDTK
ncbi:MAG: glycoside hydrolase family protein [Verrucomicrobiales bacterium]